MGSFPLCFVVLSTLTLVIIFGDFNICVDDPSLIMAFHFLDPFTSIIFSSTHFNYLLAWSCMCTSPFHHHKLHYFVNLDLHFCSSSTLSDYSSNPLIPTTFSLPTNPSLFMFVSFPSLQSIYSIVIITFPFPLCHIH